MLAQDVTDVTDVTDKGKGRTGGKADQNIGAIAKWYGKRNPKNEEIIDDGK